MTAELRRGIFLAVLGLCLGLGLVAALFGRGEDPRSAPTAQGSGPAVGAPAPEGVAPPPRADGQGPAETPPAAASRPAEAPRPAEPAPAAARAEVPATPEAPRFDIVRVEPNGESVVAGRGTPNTVVDLLVDGKPVARALADPSGQFAIVPPALKAGTSEIVLRATDAEGRETRSKDSVAVAVSPSRTEKPLVALSGPDRPTVVLSQPDARTAPGREAAKDASKDAPKDTDRDGSGGPAAKAAPTPVKIVSVDAQEGGRLFVTGRAAPGATVRLYLNETLIAPGSVGSDGTVTFTIGRGVKPGTYTVRIDQVDPVSGKVRSRAEVPFTVPEPARVAAAPAEKASREPAPPRPVPPRVPPEARSEPPKSEPPRSGPPARAEVRTAPAPRPEGATGVFVPEINTAKIVRGDSLWQISRRTYGAGDRYTVIYDANQDQIRNPDLIYPGQIFVLPGEPKETLKTGKRG